MGTKDQVSGDYTTQLKEKYQLGKEAPSPERLALVAGYRFTEHGNVAQSVTKALPFPATTVGRRGDAAKITKNITSLDDARDIFDQFADSHEGAMPDTLISCMGETDLTWFEDLDERTWYDMFNDNFFAHMFLAQEFVKRTIDDPWRKYIVLLSSRASEAYMNGSLTYCASKAAINMAVKGMAWELAPKNFIVTGVAPNSLEDSTMAHEVRQQLMKFRDLPSKVAYQYWSTGLLLERWNTTGDVAQVIAEMVDGKHDWLAGEVTHFRGGIR